MLADSTEELFVISVASFGQSSPTAPTASALLGGSEGRQPANGQFLKVSKSGFCFRAITVSSAVALYHSGEFPYEPPSSARRAGVVREDCPKLATETMRHSPTPSASKFRSGPLD